MSNRSIRYSSLCISTLLLSIIVACGGAGGDSGSDVPDNAAIQALSPLVGIWDLPDDWNGTAGDEAYLVIKSPNNDGVSEATIYDYDDAITGTGQNCFNINGSGELTQSFDNRLFLELPIADYDSAVAALKPNGDLEISTYAAGATSDSLPERVLTATRLGITENAINLC